MEKPLMEKISKAHNAARIAYEAGDLSTVLLCRKEMIRLRRKLFGRSPGSTGSTGSGSMANDTGSQT